MFWIALAIGLALSPGGVAVAAEPQANATAILEVHPNPVEHGDVGEYILLHVARPTSTADWRFSDDAGQEAVPSATTVNGTVAFSRHPSAVRPLVDHPVYPLQGTFQLANRGETITWQIGDRVVDRITYPGPAPEAERWVATEHRWVPLGATAFDPVRASGPGHAAVLPDDPAALIDRLTTAEHRLWLGGYTLSEPRVTEALLEAHRRGVDVRVHLEGRPVGGIGEPMYQSLDRLAAAAIPVTVHRGPYARWGFHHAKYAVIDDQLVVTTENWKPSGIGGQANRGWGIAIANASLADAAAAVFSADAGWRDARPWPAAREAIEPVDVGTADGDFRRAHPAIDTEVDAATLVVAPDHAEAVLTEAIAAAERSVDIIQVDLGGPNVPLVRAALDAARRGASVRFLLSGGWEVREENEAVAAAIRERAAERDLDVAIQLRGANARFDRIHAKGAIIDGERVILGSINWNNHSLRENRELALLIDDPEVAGYFAEVFEGDWPGPARYQLHLGLVGATVLVAIAVAWHARRLEIRPDEAV